VVVCSCTKRTDTGGGSGSSLSIPELSDDAETYSSCSTEEHESSSSMYVVRARVPCPIPTTTRRSHTNGTKLQQNASWNARNRGGGQGAHLRRLRPRRPRSSRHRRRRRRRQHPRRPPYTRDQRTASYVQKRHETAAECQLECKKPGRGTGGRGRTLCVWLAVNIAQGVRTDDDRECYCRAAAVATVARVQPAQELPRRPGRHSSYCGAGVATASSSVAAQ
jgi:hypothetical protein